MRQTQTRHGKSVAAMSERLQVTFLPRWTEAQARKNGSRDKKQFKDFSHLDHLKGQYRHDQSSLSAVHGIGVLL